MSHPIYRVFQRVRYHIISRYLSEFPFKFLLILIACFYTGQNLMFNVFIFADIEMSFTGRERAFCVLEYA